MRLPEISLRRRLSISKITICWFAFSFSSSTLTFSVPIFKQDRKARFWFSFSFYFSFSIDPPFGVTHSTSLKFVLGSCFIATLNPPIQTEALDRWTYTGVVVIFWGR